MIAQTTTIPQVSFLQRTSAATSTQTIYVDPRKIVDKMKRFIQILIICFLIFSTAITKIYGQCTPNSIEFLGVDKIDNDACGDSSYQNIVGTPPSGSGQTYSWEVSFAGESYTTIVNGSNVPITTSDLAKSDITNFVLLANSNTSGDYRIRRIVADSSPTSCSNTSDPVFLYYSQNSASISGGTMSGASSICTGSNGTLTLEGHTGKVLRWESAPTSAGPWTSITNNTYQYSYSNLTLSTCFRALVDNICGGTLGSVDYEDKYSGIFCVTVLNGTDGLWTGLVSTDWFDCLNWAGGLPSCSIDAQIPTTPSGGSRMPVINRDSPLASLYSFIASSRDLIISPSASVTMVSNSNSELQVSRDWKNSGVFIPGTGTVTFNGSTLDQIQTINAGIKTNETFYNLTTNNLGGALGISVMDKFELTVSNILSLTNGDIRLTGEAQLVQAGIGINPNPTGGTGILLIDQQGQNNSFNYNYWSSPVSADNLTYSVGGVLRDGTLMTNTFTDVSNFSPGSITFGDGAYFADTSNLGAIKISNRWIWSYNDLTPDTNSDWDNYYQWNYIGSSLLIKVGEGYSMKGTGGTALITTMQNYVFAGKPHSGDINNLTMSPDQTYLIGNPYPSALDADEFIMDNIKSSEIIDGKMGRNTVNVFNGVLYFWDHFSNTNSHILAGYEGGYATYTLMGGNVASYKNPFYTGTKTVGPASNEPQRFIPVGQGFFIEGTSGGPVTVDGGTIVFKNSQRAFKRESTDPSIFMKGAKAKGVITTSAKDIDLRPKIRLQFDSPLGYHRPLLVGVDERTTNNFDIGFDAPLNEDNKEDMFWLIGKSKLVIQGVNNFNDDQELQLGLKISEAGLITIKIDKVENMDDKELYIKDILTGETYNITQQPFEINLESGEYMDRFSLVFQPRFKTLEEVALEKGIYIAMNNSIAELQIKRIVDTKILSISLYNSLGQYFNTWNSALAERNISLPINKQSTGMYFVQISTTNGTIVKKIIIQ